MIRPDIGRRFIAYGNGAARLSEIVRMKTRTVQGNFTARNTDYTLSSFSIICLNTDVLAARQYNFGTIRNGQSITGTDVLIAISNLDFS